MCIYYWLPKKKKTEFHHNTGDGTGFLLISNLINETSDPTNRTNFFRKKIVNWPLLLFTVHCFQISIALTADYERKHQQQ